MIGSTRQVAVWVYEKPVDMRRSFDGLYALVKQGLGRNPLSGDCFLFVSRDRKRAKVLFWDGTGLCIYAKRLEIGRFVAPWVLAKADRLQLTMSELQILLEGSQVIGKIALSPEEFTLRSA